jgi:thiol-disulfide isomerase/thioredoxin
MPLSRTASRLALAALLLLCLSAPARAAAPAMPEDAKQHLLLGLDAIEKAKGPEDYKAAILEFQAAVAAAPDVADGYYYLGATLAQAEGRTMAALKALNRYLALAPDAPDAAKVKEQIADIEKRRAFKAKCGSIGLSPVVLADGVYVRSVSRFSPASAAGLNSGDKILKVDGKDTKGMGLYEFGALLDGNPETECVLDVLRGGETKRVAFKREQLSPSMALSREIEGDELEDEVRNSPLPVMAYIWAPWCKPCSTMSRMSARMMGFFHDKVKILSINLDNSPELAERLHVTAIPYLIFYRDGTQVDSMAGSDVNGMLQRLNALTGASQGATGRGAPAAGGRGN